MERFTLDIFPALVNLALGSHEVPVEELQATPYHDERVRQFNSARVTVLHGYVMIALEGYQGPKLVFREKAVQVFRNPTRSGLSWVVTETGKKLAIARDDACGCGSRLRSWNPERAVYGEAP